MKLKPCEFEEAEYRGPLFHQLHTTNLLWEPGQVFENHIGVDHAMWTAHALLHSLHGYSAPLHGAVLARYSWNYIWSKRKSTKRLPSFRLNVFIQAKRPQYGRYAPKVLRDKGLRSPYWRFEITPHQQIALERLKAKLSGKVLVCYACPVFHKEALLHKWTVVPRMVENSTFPDIEQLKWHSAWNFSEAGCKGVANADATSSDGPGLLERIEALVKLDEPDNRTPHEELLQLASAVVYAMNVSSDEALPIRAQFADGVRVIEEIANEYIDDSIGLSHVVAFGTVLLFAQLNRLSWFVAGNGY
jgi:hypothetical protein